MTVATARINEHGQITLPQAIRTEAHLEPGTEFDVEAAPDGSIVLRPTRDQDQWWFWTAEWQRKEREADADLAAGRFTRYSSEEAFLRSLATEGEAEESAEVDESSPTNADV